MNPSPSKTKNTVLLCFALSLGCGERPADDATVVDAQVVARNVGYRPPTVSLRADSGPTVPYMRAARADLDRPDVEVALALSPGQILGVLSVLDGAEVRQGNLAQAQAVDARVRAFGTLMVTDHTASSEQLRALAQRLRLAAIESSLGQVLRVETADTATRLSALEGEVFDREYIHAQVFEHTRAIEVIDGLLIPNASDEGLRTALETEIRPAVMAHWSHVRDLQTEMAGP